jgi:site-specific recombinase XerD
MKDKIKPVTKLEWDSINPVNKQMVEEYLDSLVDLSEQTLKQYTSSIRIYFRFIKEQCKDIPFYEIKSRDYIKYQNTLSRGGMSSSGVAFKRSTISAFNDWIITYYSDIYPTFHNYITKQIKKPPKAFVHKKEPLTEDELNQIIKVLEEKEMWQQLAYLTYTYSTGCRRTESRLLLKEVADYEIVVKKKTIKDENGEDIEVEKKYYVTHEIRCKGSGHVGKVRKLKFDERAMYYIKKWLEVRGNDDCPYMFISKYRGTINKVSESTFGDWCHNYFEPVIGRRIHPHLFRESRATNLVVYQNKDIETAQCLLGHESSETTQIYLIRDTSEDSDDAF